jgi:hypothetical protein
MGGLDRTVAISLLRASTFGPDLLFTPCFVNSITESAATMSTPINPLAAFRRGKSAGMLLPKNKEKSKPGM